MEKTGEYRKYVSPCSDCGRPSSRQSDGLMLCSGCAGARQVRKSASHPVESLGQASRRLNVSVEDLANAHQD